MSADLNIRVRLDEFKKGMQQIPGITQKNVKKAAKVMEKEWTISRAGTVRMQKAAAKQQRSVLRLLEKDYKYAFRSMSNLYGEVFGDLEDIIELTFTLGKTFAAFGPIGIAVGVVAAATGAAALAFVGMGAAAAGAVAHIKSLTQANSQYVRILELQREGNKEAHQVAKELSATLQLIAVFFREIAIRIAQDAAPEIQKFAELTAGMVLTLVDMMNAIPKGYFSIVSAIKRLANFMVREAFDPVFKYVQTFQELLTGLARAIELASGQSTAVSDSLRQAADFVADLDNNLTAGVDAVVDYGVELTGMGEALIGFSARGKAAMDDLVRADFNTRNFKKFKEKARKELESIKAAAKEARAAIKQALESRMFEEQGDGDGKLKELMRRRANLVKAQAKIIAEINAIGKTASDENVKALRDANEEMVKLDEDMYMRRIEIRNKLDKELEEKAAKARELEEKLRKERMDGQEKFMKESIGGFIKIADAAGVNAEVLAAAKLVETIAYQAVAVARAFAEGGPLLGPAAAATAIGTIGAQIAALAKVSGQNSPRAEGVREVKTPQQMRANGDIGGQGNNNTLVVVNEYRGRVFDEQVRDSQRRKGSPLRNSNARRRRRRNG